MRNVLSYSTSKIEDDKISRDPPFIEDHNILVKAIPNLFAKLGWVDKKRGTEAFSLAWPIIITGALRVALRLIDFLMVGIAVGAVGVAALGLGYQFFFIGFASALAISSGTISLVSQNYGAGNYDRANLVIKQSIWIAFFISVPLIIVTYFYAEEMISILGAESEVVALGGPYLRILMVGVFFRFFSMIASRAFAGTGNTITPMYVRSIGIPFNIVLNWLLIFGIGFFPELGVFGAGLGTTLTNLALSLVFLILLVSQRYEISLNLSGKQWDTGVVKNILTVSIPLLLMRMARTIGRFPFLWILSYFGTGALAAYQVGQRVELFAMEPAWGLGTAASTLVGQSLGKGEDKKAERYGWDTLKLAIGIMVPIGFIIALFANPISSLFADDLEAIYLGTLFIWINAFGVLGFAINRIMRGSLRGAGDTRWPFYGNLIGIYLWMLPVSYFFGIVLGYGLPAVFVGILGSFFLPGIVNFVRFKSGKWKEVSEKFTGV